MCSCTYLGVDADDRHTPGGATGALGGDALELRIAVGMGGVGELLAVDAQGKAGPPEQAGDGASADLESLPTERDSQLAGGTARPLGTPAGVARRLAFEQPRQRRDERRLFFSSDLRPPPGLRTGPRWSFPDSSSSRPRRRDSRPAYSRRSRSSSRLMNSVRAESAGAGRRGGRRQRAVAELTGAQLAGAPGGITGTVQEAAGEGFASQTAGACELAQGVLGGYAQQGVELADGEARAGLGRERLDGGEQRAVPGVRILAKGVSIPEERHHRSG